MTISVIIPTWNRADSVLKSIQSVLAQTILPLEILVCDDGSTDNTRAVVEGLQNPLVHFLPGEHSGNAATPRNRGLAAARGEYIAFLDSDDTWLPTKLEKQIKSLEQSGLQASATNAWRILPDEATHAPLLSFTEKEIHFKKILRNNVIICSAVLIQTSLLKEAGGFPEFNAKTSINEDYALWLRILTRNSFSYISEPLLNYNDDATHSFRSKNTKGPYEQKQYILKDLIVWLKKTSAEKKYLQEARREYFRTSLIKLLK